jgi:hypothetical protein
MPGGTFGLSFSNETDLLHGEEVSIPYNADPSYLAIALQDLLFNNPGAGIDAFSCGRAQPPITLCAQSFDVYVMNGWYVIELMGELVGVIGARLDNLLVDTSTCSTWT